MASQPRALNPVFPTVTMAFLTNPKKCADMMPLSCCGLNPNLDSTLDQQLVWSWTSPLTTHTPPPTTSNHIPSKPWNPPNVAYTPSITSDKESHMPPWLQTSLVDSVQTSSNSYGILPITMHNSPVVSIWKQQSTSQMNKLRGLEYHENCVCLLTCLYKGVALLAYWAPSLT